MQTMKEAASYLVGTHDFVSFCNVRTDVEDTVRTIYSLDIEKQGDEITIRISGNGFLYNMVRIIVGTLIRVIQNMIFVCFPTATIPWMPV